TLVTIIALAAASTTAVAAQTQGSATEAAPQDSQASSRQAAIEAEQAAKSKALHPYLPNKGEQIFRRLDAVLEGGTPKWHPVFDSAYSGGGFTFGLGHVSFLSAYNFIDVRG